MHIHGIYSYRSAPVPDVSFHVVWAAFRTRPRALRGEVLYNSVKIELQGVSICTGTPRHMEKKEMEHMKKRLISFLLALSMMLSLVPVGAVADDTSTFADSNTITATDLGLDSNNKPTNPGGEGYGWTYDSTSKTLTIKKDYSLNLGSETLDCTKVSVVNNGVITGGTFKIAWVSSDITFTNNGTIQKGFFDHGNGGVGYIYNSAGSQINGGFFANNVIATKTSGSASGSYTITGGFFFDTPTHYSGNRTYVKICSSGSFYRESYVLDKAVGYEDPLNSSSTSKGFYLFGANQSVTLTIPSRNTIVDEWRYLKDDKYVNAEGDSACPVTVTPIKAASDNTDASTYRQVTITSKGTSPNCSVSLYRFAYKTTLDILENGLPDTTNVYEKDGIFYALNPAVPGSSVLSEKAKWIYDDTDTSNKILTLNHVSSHGSSFDLSNLSKDITVKITDASSTRTIRADGTVESPLTINGPVTFSKGTFSSVTLTGNGSIDKDSTATFTNVTLSGTNAKINGGVFNGTVTLAEGADIEQITGGLFAQDIKDASDNGQLYRVTLKDGSTFKVSGYTNNFSYVYVSPSTTLAVTSTDADAKAFGRINGKAVTGSGASLTSNGKTITFTVSDLITKGVVSAEDKTIVLAPALEDVTASMFTVTNNKTYTYGDTVAKEDFSIEKTDAAIAAGVGEASIAGYYKVTNGTADTTGEPLTTVSDAGTYQVVLKVEETDTYAGNDKLTSDSDSWRFTIAKKPITAEDFTFEALESLTYDGTEKAVTITAKDNVGTISKVLYAAEGSSNYTDTAPTDAGTYHVTATVTPDANHTFVQSALPTDWVFTIQKANLTAKDFHRVNGSTLAEAGMALNDNIKGAGEVSFTYKPVADIATQSLTPDTMNSGVYQFYVSVTDGKNYNAVDGLTDDNDPDWQFTIDKRTLTEDDFDITVPTSLSYDGKPKEVTAEYKNGSSPITFGAVTVKYEKQTADGTTWESFDGIPTDAGTYRFKLEVAASANNDQQTIEPENNTFTIQPHTFDIEDFELVHPTDMREDGSPKNVSVKPTKTVLYTEGENGNFVWKLYRENDDGTYTLLDEMPTKAGSYVYAVWVKKDANHIGYDTVAALPTDGECRLGFGMDAPVHCSYFGWFDILEPMYSLTIEGGTARFRDVDATEDTAVPENTKTSVPAKAIVYLTVNTTAPDEPDITLLAADADSEIETCPWYVVSGTKVELSWDGDTNEWYFEMPYADVRLTTTEPVTPTGGGSGSSSAGTGAAIVLSGAALGGAAYLIGTELWMQANLPAGAAIPTSRQQLAALLWDAAGRPEPAGTALFTDISAAAADSQKAARWCVEQGLMQAEGDTFQPAKHTFRPQVIKAWKQLQASRKAD